jgi:predicted TIM-barrel fold metal-dependent hydrolase
VNRDPQGEVVVDDKVLMVSADGHAGGPPALYRGYIEKRYLPDLEALVAVDDEWRESAISQSRFGAEVLDLIDRGDAIRGGGERGAWELDRRVAELDREGVAAEVLIPGHQVSMLPFFGVINTAFSPDLRAAGVRAYHRHLADGMADSGGRLFGIADPGPCLDLDETVKELEWVSDHGFVGTAPPGQVHDPALPPLSHPSYEPFWATCAERGLVLNIHAGYGAGQFGELAAQMKAMMGTVPPEEQLRMQMTAEVSIDQFPKDSPQRTAITAPRRSLWQLMLGGVFDRHPNLKIVFTEVRADWVPDTLAWLDSHFEGKGFALSPSEYWARHCYVAPSSPRPYEVALRSQIGMDRFMFGMDFPHPEGTWPNTREWLRHSFAGVPVDELRKLVGLNAVECYGLDLPSLTAVADKIGLSSVEVSDPTPVDPRLVDQFHARSGYARPAESFDPAVYQEMLDEDVALVGGS